MSNILTTTDLATYLGTGSTVDDGRAALVVKAVNVYIEQTTGRAWGGVSEPVTEILDYEHVVFLSHQDIAAVSLVKTGPGMGPFIVIPADRYFCNDGGRLVISRYRNDFLRRRDQLIVTYTYGRADVPDDLKLAAISLAADYYNYAAQGQKEISASYIGSYRLMYTADVDSKVGKSYDAVINRYRTRHI